MQALTMLGISIYALVFLSCVQAVSFSHAEITLDAQTTYQTITGWETTGGIGQSDLPNEFLSWRDAAIEQAIELGINRIRLEVRSGSENPVDYYTPYINGQASRDSWRQHSYEIINDDSDSFTINPRGFNFAEMDHRIEYVVNPFRQRLAARGESLLVNLNYVDFGSSNFRHRDAPEEYAEFILATYKHIQSKYGWVPDFVEVVLEPNNAGWSAVQVGRAIVAAASRLRDNGFRPAFIAPSTSGMSSAVSYFDQLIQVPGALDNISELAYHRYGGVSDTALQSIASRATQHGINTAMLEHIGSGYEELHKDLKMGRNSAWQQYTLAYPTSDNGAQYFFIDRRTPSNPAVNIGRRTKFLRQYFKFIKRGARRIEATSDDSNLDPLAFINTDGKYVVVVKAEGAGTFTLRSLPAGTYGIKYTTASQYDVDSPDVTLNAGEPLSASIPDEGVITVYAKQTSQVPPGDQAVIEQCRLERSSSGKYTLTLIGRNFKAGAKVTINGAKGKKLRFKDEVQPGQGIFTRLEVKKKVCGSLPGPIIITNPGGQPSAPFQFSESCQ
jgi:hypothetical protein